MGRPARKGDDGEETTPMDLPTIRVGIVGAGANTVAHHIPGLRAQPGVEITTVVNRTRASSERVAAAQGIPDVADHWSDLVADPDIDAVVVGTWPNLHRPVTIAGLEAGKHVLCEARMAMTVEDAWAMWDASRARPHLVAQVVPSPLSFGVDATIRRLVTEGWLGRPLSVDVAVASGEFPDVDAPLHWRQDGHLSGRNIMSLGIWYEAVMRWLGEATEVTALGSVTVSLRRDTDGGPRAVTVPDHLDVLARMASGATARFRITDVLGLTPANRATLHGTDGVLIFEAGGLTGGRRADTGLSPIPIPDHEVGTWRVEEEFIAAIRGHEQVRLTDFATGVRYMEFTEAVWRSMQERKAIPLPLGR